MFSPMLAGQAPHPMAQPAGSASLACGLGRQRVVRQLRESMTSRRREIVQRDSKGASLAFLRVREGRTR